MGGVPPACMACNAPLQDSSRPTRFRLHEPSDPNLAENDTFLPFPRRFPLLQPLRLFKRLCLNSQPPFLTSYPPR